MKDNISYYKHDVHSHTHWKFKALRRKYGWEGEGRFWALNNLIGDSSGCFLDLSSDTKRNGIAAELDLDPDDLMEFIRFLVDKCSLLIDKNDTYTTDDVQDVFCNVDEKRRYQREWKTPKETSKTAKSITKTQKSILDFEQREESKGKRREESKVNIDGECSLQDSVPEPADPENGKQKLLVKQQQMQKRKLAFYNSLIPFLPEYGKEMIRAFFNYWSEPNKSQTLMGFEMKPTWFLAGRLATWYKKDQKNSANGTKSSPGNRRQSADDLINANIASASRTATAGEFDGAQSF